LGFWSMAVKQFQQVHSGIFAPHCAWARAERGIGKSLFLAVRVESQWEVGGGLALVQAR
jgi:hypothetical protein